MLASLVTVAGTGCTLATAVLVELREWPTGRLGGWSEAPTYTIRSCKPAFVHCCSGS